jgi:hypothetical protein
MGGQVPNKAREVYELVRDQVVKSVLNGDWTTEDLIAWLELRANRAEQEDAGRDGGDADA